MTVIGERLLMEVDQAATSPAFDDFLQTGRTGRRNALPDIRDNSTVSTSSLPDGMEKLSCSDPPPNGTVGSGQANDSASSSNVGNTKS